MQLTNTSCSLATRTASTAAISDCVIVSETADLQRQTSGGERKLGQIDWVRYWLQIIIATEGGTASHCYLWDGARPFCRRPMPRASGALYCKVGKWADFFSYPIATRCARVLPHLFLSVGFWISCSLLFCCWFLLRVGTRLLALQCWLACLIGYNRLGAGVHGFDVGSIDTTLATWLLELINE